MRYLPLFFNLRDRRCLVVGGGAIANRKVGLLRRAGGRVTVVAIRAGRDIAALGDDAAIDLLKRPFVAGDVSGMAIVIAATGDPATDEAVARAARDAGIPVGVVDKAGTSDIVFPAIVDRDPLIVAVSTGGAAPVLARRVRAMVEALLPASLGALARAAERLRPAVRRRFAEPRARRRFWEGFFRHQSAAAMIARGGSDLADSDDDRALSSIGAGQGAVAIVGAGPGDPELLTLKALHRLQEADVIVHDRLVGAEILDYARRDAELIYVGKERGRHSYGQGEINALLAHHAAAGRFVVRLKGGDPFVFGRGGEELEYLRGCGIAVETVPGITAALGCAAAAGVPLTHRGEARAVTLLTGAVGGELPDLDWSAHARSGATLAIYMGVATAGALAAKLIEGGADAATPIKVIENGTRENERVLGGTLGGLGRLIEDEAVRAPALLVVGSVAGRAGILAADGLTAGEVGA
ncbi:MAG: siroheme synthase CysG [Alphaproteobacteria bacterium]